jgi:dTDP-glucose 4,6-dehydratase
VILVTGGAGFIGSNFVLDWLGSCDEPIVNLDLLTYAGNLQNVASLEGDPRHIFLQGDICDMNLVTRLLSCHKPRAIVHFAAESHVDRSIVGPAEFVRTNVNGTFTLLEAARAYSARLAPQDRDHFRFLHVSTDEVFGSLREDEPAFSEKTPYAPSSPYAASKAAADHLVRAYHRTYGLPTLITNCSNNYGPYQFPEKLIPLMIVNALDGKPLPIYGDGLNVRDWIYVLDHCAGVRAVLEKGQPGQTYGLGGNCEVRNIDVVKTLCAILDELHPKQAGSYSQQIAYVKDRPGHDRRYAMNTEKAQRELGWLPTETFSSGLRRTVEWFLASKRWVDSVRSGAYRQWIETHYSGAT